MKQQRQHCFGSDQASLTGTNEDSVDDTSETLSVEDAGLLLGELAIELGKLKGRWLARSEGCSCRAAESWAAHPADVQPKRTVCRAASLSSGGGRLLFGDAIAPGRVRRRATRCLRGPAHPVGRRHRGGWWGTAEGRRGPEARRPAAWEAVVLVSRRPQRWA